MMQSKVLEWLYKLQQEPLTHNNHLLIQTWITNKAITIDNPEQLYMLKSFLLLSTNCPCMIRSIIYANNLDYLLILLNKLI